MNKKIIICITIIATFIALCCIVINNSIENKKIKAEKEIIDIFNGNKELFANVSNELFEFKYHWSLRKEKYDEEIRSDWKSVVLKSGIQLVIQEQDYFNEMSLMRSAVENNKSIEDVMKKLNIKTITSNSRIDSGCIYFIMQTTPRLSSGIIYCPNGKPENSYITKLTAIDYSWFYFEEK